MVDNYNSLNLKFKALNVENFIEQNTGVRIQNSEETLNLLYSVSCLSLVIFAFDFYRVEKAYKTLCRGKNLETIRGERQSQKARHWGFKPEKASAVDLYRVVFAFDFYRVKRFLRAEYRS